MTIVFLFRCQEFSTVKNVQIVVQDALSAKLLETLAKEAIFLVDGCCRVVEGICDILMEVVKRERQVY